MIYSTLNIGNVAVIKCDKNEYGKKEFKEYLSEAEKTNASKIIIEISNR